LDVGTGSGILAIAAAKLWKNSEIIAVDIDEESVIVAAQNAKDNGVEKQITAAYSDGYSSDLVQKSAPYDVILANILARPLISMAKDMAHNLKKGGFAVISGFIDNQVEWVLSEHEKYGLKLQKIYEEDNWRTALLKKE
jgi:ribosomal protein L11 methyltransferase